MNANIKDLFKATKNYATIIKRLSIKAADYYNMLDAREDAIYMIKSDTEASSEMKDFLLKRINAA